MKHLGLWLIAITCTTLCGCASKRNTTFVGEIPYGKVSEIVICDLGFSGDDRNAAPAPGDSVWLVPTDIRITDRKAVRRLHKVLAESPLAKKHEGVYWLSEVGFCAFLDHKGDVLALVYVNIWDCEVFVARGKRKGKRFINNEQGSPSEDPYLRSVVRSEEFCRVVLSLMREHRPKWVEALDREAKEMFESNVEDVLFRNDVVLKRYHRKRERE